MGNENEIVLLLVYADSRVAARGASYGVLCRVLRPMAGDALVGISFVRAITPLNKKGKGKREKGKELLDQRQTHLTPTWSMDMHSYAFMSHLFNGRSSLLERSLQHALVFALHAVLDSLEDIVHDRLGCVPRSGTILVNTGAD